MKRPKPVPQGCTVDQNLLETHQRAAALHCVTCSYIVMSTGSVVQDQITAKLQHLAAVNTH